MNEIYLLNKIASHTRSTARKFDAGTEPVICSKTDLSLDDSFIIQRLFRAGEFLSGRPDAPYIFSVSGGLLYAWVPAETAKSFYLLGPVRFESVLPLLHKTDDIIEGSQRLIEFSKSVPYCNADRFCEDILLLYNLTRDAAHGKKPFDAYDLLMHSCTGMDAYDDALSLLYKRIFSSIEESTVHNPYNHEKRQVSAIKDGNPELLSGILSEEFSSRYGILSQDPLKQAKYIGIVETTLASRAAIQGGVHPETAYNLSDITIQKIDACTDIASIRIICRKMQLEYATMVQSIRQGDQPGHAENENTHVSHCKDYIFTHLHGRVTVREIAAAIGLEENYLSSLFRRHEHKTLTSYIMEEKISLAKNMLIYSDYSFAQISAYLGFSSQSHFGQSFKKITGMTPRTFRDIYADDDFINSSIQTG